MAKKKKASKGWKKNQRRLYREMAAAGMAGAAPPAAPGLLGGLARLLPSRTSEQFLVGALVGAGVAYVMADEELRGKLITSAVKLYTAAAGGLAEIREQVADAQAEVQAGMQAGMQAGATAADP